MAAVFDASEHMFSIFHNGHLVSTSAIHPRLDGAPHLLVDSTFKGFMSDLRIWSGVRAQPELRRGMLESDLRPHFDFHTQLLYPTITTVRHYKRSPTDAERQSATNDVVTLCDLPRHYPDMLLSGPQRIVVFPPQERLYG